MDSDLFDDILADNSVKTARSGKKFQPKAKPCGPRLMTTDSGRTTLTSSQPVQTSDVSENELKEYCETDRAAASDDNRSFAVVNASPQHLRGTKNVASIASLGPVMDVVMSNTGEDWDSCFGKSVGENADIFIGLESLGDFLPNSTTVLDNFVPSPGAPNVQVSNRDAVHWLPNPLFPSVGDSISSISCSHTDNRNLETEELETHPCLETLDMSELTTSSGRQTGKYQPKSKIRHIDGEAKLAFPVQMWLRMFHASKNMQSVSPEIDIMDQTLVPSFAPDDDLDFSHLQN
ncbi:hypothetical protein ACH5RR_015978 [Cinchona calisaya]|uniref:Uncharacterized protein n=1 Tax=Cinchona calisaya TaxID=153742 RepID=A0ABD2ZVK7_9GENT